MAINTRRSPDLHALIQSWVELPVSKKKHVVVPILFAAAMFTLGVNMKPSAAQDTASVPKSQNRLALGEDDVKQLMLVIGPNKEGKITKQAWMKFMSAEFDRLDKDKSGTLDTTELAQSQLRVASFSEAGK
jgi:hypothetical protein